MNIFRSICCAFRIMMGLLLWIPATAICQDKEFSKPFRSDIQEVCPSCKKKLGFFQLSNSEFHNAHVYFSQGNIDASYVLIVAQFESEMAFLDEKKKYVLKTLEGIILDEKKLYQDAVESLEEAIAIGNANEYTSVRSLYAILGQVYLEQRKFEEGAQWLEQWKSYTIWSEEEASVNLHNLGLCYLHLKLYDKAEANLLHAFRLNEQYKDTLGLARSSLDIANLYYVQYKDEQAITFFEKGLEFAKRAQDLTVLQNAYLNLAVVNENAETYKEALQYRKAYEKIHDSIWNRDQIWKLAQKEKEIAVSAREEKLKEETLRKNLYGVIGLILFLAVLVGGYVIRKIWKQKQVITQLNHAKDKLFSILTHDLKTPVHAIQTKLHLTLQTANDPLQSSLPSFKLVSESYQLSKKTSLLIDNTLHWILQSKDQLFFHPQRLQVSSILEQVWHDYLPVIDDKNLIVKLEVSQGLYVYSDQNSVKVIVRNLLDNAIKFTPSGGAIHCKVYEEETYVVIQLKDTGSGFDTASYENNRLISRKSTADTQGRTGTGLGLELCKELVEKNNGYLWFVSEKGAGTTVGLKLPKHKN